MASKLPTQREVQSLLSEVRRYLAAVDVFRAEGYEPHWLPAVSRGLEASATLVSSHPTRRKT